MPIAEPWKAKGVALQCPNCFHFVEVTLPYKPTVEQRQRLIAEAVDEHRRICTAAPPEDARVYSINYPRV